MVLWGEGWLMQEEGGAWTGINDDWVWCGQCKEVLQATLALLSLCHQAVAGEKGKKLKRGVHSIQCNTDSFGIMDACGVCNTIQEGHMTQFFKETSQCHRHQTCQMHMDYEAGLRGLWNLRNLIITNNKQPYLSVHLSSSSSGTANTRLILCFTTSKVVFMLQTLLHHKLSFFLRSTLARNLIGRLIGVFMDWTQDITLVYTWV